MRQRHIYKILNKRWKWNKRSWKREHKVFYWEEISACCCYCGWWKPQKQERDFMDAERITIDWENKVWAEWVAEYKDTRWKITYGDVSMREMMMMMILVKRWKSTHIYRHISTYTCGHIYIHKVMLCDVTWRKNFFVPNNNSSKQGKNHFLCFYCRFSSTVCCHLQHCWT